MDAQKRKRDFQPLIQRRLNGRTFQKNGSHNDNTYYRCATIYFHATAYAKADNVLHMGRKSHAPHCEDDEKDQVVQMKHWMKTEMQEKWWSFLELYEVACQRFEEAATKVSLDRLRPSLKVWRLKVFPPTPQTIGQFAQQLQDSSYDKLMKYKTHTLKATVAYDEDECVHILFYDEQFIKSNLTRIKQLFIDATYDSRPQLRDCVQLLNILGIYLGRAVSMFQVVMSRKTKAAYLAVFKKVLEVSAFEDVITIMSDFENPLRSSLAELFPQAQIVGCNFHFDKAIYGKLKTLNLVQEVKSNRNLENTLKKILALAFLPSYMIRDEYYRQKETMEDDVKKLLARFLEYFERYWLRIVTPAAFSVYGLTNRTNNISESWNSELFHLFGKNPVAAKMTQQLMLLTVRTRTQVEQRRNFQFGSTFPRYQTQYKDAQLKIGWIKLMDPDANFSPEEFIECAARLKGNLNEKLKNFRDGYVKLQTEMTEKPSIVPMSKDTEFDLSLVMDPASRRVYEQLKRQRRNQDENIPHFYRQNGGNQQMNILEDQARAILAQFDENNNEVEQQVAPANEKENADNHSHISSSSINDEQSIAEQSIVDDIELNNSNNTDVDSDTVLPSKRRKINVLQSQLTCDAREHVIVQQKQITKSKILPSQDLAEEDLFQSPQSFSERDAPSEHDVPLSAIQKSTEGEKIVQNSALPVAKKHFDLVAPLESVQSENHEDCNSCLCDNVQITDESFECIIADILGNKNNSVENSVLPSEAHVKAQNGSGSAEINKPFNTNSKCTTPLDDPLDTDIILPETQSGLQPHQSMLAEGQIIEDSDIDMFASDNEEAVGINDHSTAVASIQNRNSSTKKSQKKNRQSYKQRLRQKKKHGDKRNDNCKPKKMRKRCKKKKQN